MEETTMKNSSRVFVGLALVIALGGGYYFYSQKPKSVDSSVSQPSSSAMAPAEEGIKVITLEAGSFYYQPSAISVKKDDKVKVVINSVSMIHDFVIDELNVKSSIAKSGESTSVMFVADKVGSFEFYCSIGQHRQSGMVGTPTVTE